MQPFLTSKLLAAPLTRDLLLTAFTKSEERRFASSTLAVELRLTPLGANMLGRWMGAAFDDGCETATFRSMSREAHFQPSFFEWDFCTSRNGRSHLSDQTRCLWLLNTHARVCVCAETRARTTDLAEEPQGVCLARDAFDELELEPAVELPLAEYVAAVSGQHRAARV